MVNSDLKGLRIRNKNTDFFMSISDSLRYLVMLNASGESSRFLGPICVTLLRKLLRQLPHGTWALSLGGVYFLMTL